MIKLLVFIFGQTTGYRIYTVSREPIRLQDSFSVFQNSFRIFTRFFQCFISTEEGAVLRKRFRILT